MDLAIAKNIIEKETKSEIRLIEDTSKGWDHKVYIAQTNKGCFVLRVPIKDQNKIKIQAWACNKWHKLGVPVPKPIILRKNYLIEKCVPGIDMEDAKLTIAQKKSVYKKMCYYLKKMHKVKTKGYGPLVKPGVGKYKFFKDYIDSFINHKLKFCLRKGMISAKTAKEIMKEYAELEAYFRNFKNPCLVHADLCVDNIMILNNKFSGVIDAADASSGDPLFDPAAILFENPNNIFLNWLIKIYGKENARKIRFYAILGRVSSLYCQKEKKGILKRKGILKNNKKILSLLNTTKPF